MELVEQYALPGLAQGSCGRRNITGDRRQGTQSLGSHQGLFRLTILSLDARKRRVAATRMVLQIIMHHRPGAPQALYLAEIALWCGEHRLHRPGRAHRLHDSLHVAAGGAAAVVAHAVKAHHQGQALRRLRGRSVHTLHDVRIFRAAVVQRRTTGQYPRPPGGLPPEGPLGEDLFMWARAEKDIGIQTPKLQQLRQGAGMAEGIHVVTHARPLAQVLLQEALPIKRMAGEGFPAGDIAVRLQPPAIGQSPATLSYGLEDGSQQLRIILGNPLVGNRSTTGEHVTLEFLEQSEGRAIGRQHLRPALA